MSGGSGRTAAPERPQRGGRASTRTRPPVSVDPPSGRVVRSQVEPRIVERRRTVRDAARARRRRIWTAVAVVVALVAAAVGVLLSPLTDVDEIVVTGTDRLSSEELVSVAGIRTGDQLVELDLSDARDRLRALPWVSSASVTRRWPAGVEIVVLEERPAVVVDDGSTAAVVSSTGRVLALERPSGDTAADGLNTALLPRLELEDPGAARWEIGTDVPADVRSAATVFARMSDAVLAEIPVGRLDDDGALHFDLDEGAVVFGPLEDVPEKLATIESVLSQVVRDCMSRLDVREPSRPTVSRVDGCDLPDPLDAGVPTDTDSETAPDAAGANGRSTAAGAGG